ncbi:hypothetical protein LPUS_07700 [Lasallia pustulata]|uniref:Uncharacterized protein n=1 Tax=Lasallia pustulata TaxID=136370 RepID=A0A1W5D3P4_9LECA|nr:hypothetical protein LPUS_07700 [Lasallia pustulata]
MDFELDEPTMDSNYDDYYDASEGGDPPPAAPAEDSEGGPVVKVEDLEEHEVKEGDVEEHRVKRKHIIRSNLEADVDDPPAGDEWRQADEDEASDPNDVQVSGVNGEDPMEADSNEENDHDASDNGHDEMLATMTTRNLSVGPPISSEQVTAPTPSPASPPSSAPAPTTNLLTRRIGSRPTLPRPGEVTDAASLDIDARKSLSSEKSNATTSQHPPGEAPTAEASSTLRATATRPLESLGADGLTTPRNDAGPFVFDGSAGRGSGPIVVASLAEAIDSPTSTTSYAGTDTSDGVPAPT